MLDALDDYSSAPFTENEESYQTLIDESYFTVIRCEGVYVCQVHLPANFGDLAFELGRLGFVVMDAYGEGDVLDLKLRKLGDVPLDDEETYFQTNIAGVQPAPPKEMAHA